jgi:UDP-N-acetylmuramoylalanine-D-glutamate ligase
MIFKKILKNKNFLVYGLGLTGISAMKFLKKEKAKNIYLWDDNIKFRKRYKVRDNDKSLKKKFSKADYIVLSPGISLIRAKKK